jgi:urease accessory protein UreF
MTFTEKDIEKLQALYSARYGTNISRQQAVEIGNRLVNLFRAALKPAPHKVSGVFNRIKQCQ